MSIQRDLNGLSFFDTDHNALAVINNIDNYSEIYTQLESLSQLSSSVEIVITTDNFITVPSSLYSKRSEEVFFAAKSLPYSLDKFKYLKFRVKEDVTTIAVIENSIFNCIDELFENINFTHSVNETILNSLRDSANTISIYESHSRVAISLSIEGKLIFSEQLPLTNRADLVYYITKLTKDNQLSEYKILCSGLKQKLTAQTLSNYFNNIFFI
ncbi:MAG: DUF3822 family protein [Rikenellaceae bacterium]